MHIVKDLKPVAREGHSDVDPLYIPTNLLTPHLSVRCFNEASNSLFDSSAKSCQCSALCVKRMADCAGIHLDPREIRLYCLLRTQQPELFDGKPAKPETARDSWQMSDQQLLAEILKMTGDKERLCGFYKFYKSIFRYPP